MDLPAHVPVPPLIRYLSPTVFDAGGVVSILITGSNSPVVVPNDVHFAVPLVSIAVKT